jgi:hypothetical protein
MLRVSGGALNPVVSVEMESEIALVHATGPRSGHETSICGHDVIALLHSMGYSEQKEVSFPSADLVTSNSLV